MEGSGEKKESSFFDRLRDATAVVAAKTKEGVGDLQTKYELSQAYGELGRKTVELVESGAVSHHELAERVEKIAALKKQLEDEEAEAAAAETPAEQAPAEPSEPAG